MEAAQDPIRIRGPVRGVSGELRPPGDKSITHRSLFLGGLASGGTRIVNALDAADVNATADALVSLGASIAREGSDLLVSGPLDSGVDSVALIDCADSGTTARILCGVASGLCRAVGLDGSDSLRRRPMLRVIEPLVAMGARFDMGTGETLPVSLLRGEGLHGEDHRLTIPSAQVKTSLLLAGVLAEGVTSVEEPMLSRDHTERMLPLFGVDIEREGLRVQVSGGSKMSGTTIAVPGDLSSALYAGVAALIVSGSELRLTGVGVNPTRTGGIDVLRRMGGDIESSSEWEECGEPRADLTFRSSGLRGVEVLPDEFPRLLDDIPILAVAACRAHSGVTVFRGAAELRKKESDRIRALATMLGSFGARTEEGEDFLAVHGGGELHAAEIDAHGDHRIALSAAVLALTIPGETLIHGFETTRQSMPDFFSWIEPVTDGLGVS